MTARRDYILNQKAGETFSERKKLVALCGFTGFNLIFFVINFCLSLCFKIFDFLSSSILRLRPHRAIMDFVWFRSDLMHQRRARAETTSFPKVLMLRLYLEQSKVDVYFYCKIML